MVTRSEIFAYHAKEGTPPERQGIGIEFELFCINAQTLNNVTYIRTGEGPTIQEIFEYLKAHEGYATLGTTKTFGLQKGNSKLTLEPGSQLEFDSAIHENLDDLLQEFRSYLLTLQQLATTFAVHWLDAAYFPVGLPTDLKLLPSPRYAILDRYWRHIGTYGPDIMRYTTSLQVCLDYSDLTDLERKVTRALLLKPILLFLTARSRIRAGTDSGLRSFRSITYNKTDPPRMGTPGPEQIWSDGRWTLEGYIDKVLQATTLFTVGSTSYAESDHQAFEASRSASSLDDYLFHLSSIFTDVRVRQYIEIRYLDNPGIALVPGMAILLYHLLYNEALWEIFAPHIPYTFAQVPAITDMLNTISPVSDSYWEQSLREPVAAMIHTIQEHLSPALAEQLRPLHERALDHKKYEALPDMRERETIVSHFIPQLHL
jgi:glutamate--cysteine ligase